MGKDPVDRVLESRMKEDAMPDVKCPVCKGKASGMRDGDEYVVGEHEAMVDDNHLEACDGVGEHVGDEAVIKDPPDKTSRAA